MSIEEAFDFVPCKNWFPARFDLRKAHLAWKRRDVYEQLLETYCVTVKYFGKTITFTSPWFSSAKLPIRTEPYCVFFSLKECGISGSLQCHSSLTSKARWRGLWCKPYSQHTLKPWVTVLDTFFLQPQLDKFILKAQYKSTLARPFRLHNSKDVEHHFSVTDRHCERARSRRSYLTRAQRQAQGLWTPPLTNGLGIRLCVVQPQHL
jgi:hypothetical protein